MASRSVRRRETGSPQAPRQVISASVAASHPRDSMSVSRAEIEKNCNKERAETNYPAAVSACLGRRACVRSFSDGAPRPSSNFRNGRNTILSMSGNELREPVKVFSAN